ncbi:MAG: helix-hairpin-helix domain-containing protein, partial [Candidatus Methanomethylophilaceae archaeon]
RNAVNKIKDEVKDFPILHAVSSTPDVLGLYPRKKDEEILSSLQETWCNDLLVDIPEDEDYQYEYFLSNMKTAALMMDWISETDEDTITDNMGIGPGDIRSRVDMVDWILYAMSEIAVIYKPEIVKKLRPMLVRVRYGVKKELIDLVSFRGVGRARARILYDNGIRTRKDITEVDFSKLANLPRIGPALAKSMKEQVGADNREIKFVPDSIDEEIEIRSPTVRDTPKQSKLLDF